MNYADDPESTEITILATTEDDRGRKWVVIEERRMSLLLVDSDVAPGSEWLMSPDRLAETSR